MSRDWCEDDCHACGDSSCRYHDHDCGHRGHYGATPKHHPYLSDAFGAYQGFWVRQSEYWYDAIGRFVCGQYRTEDYSKDAARYWDGWMADYERWLQFPHRKARAGSVPNVVFVLDELAEGSSAKEVPLGFTLGRTRPRLDATALVSPSGDDNGGAYIRAEFDSRGYYARIQLVNAGGMERTDPDAHFMSVVHTDSRLPVAVVHVVKRLNLQRESIPGGFGAAYAPGRAAASSGAASASASASVDAVKEAFVVLRKLGKQVEDLQKLLDIRGKQAAAAETAPSKPPSKAPKAPPKDTSG